MNFRLAASTDLDTLADIRWGFVKEDGGDMCLSQSEFRSIFKQWSTSHPNCYHFVAEEGDSIVSVMSVLVIEPLPRPIQTNPAWGYLTNVCSVPAKRGAGIASGLMRFVKNWIQEKQLETVIVWPSDESIAFYERAGFNQQNKIMEFQIAVSSDEKIIR